MLQGCASPDAMELCCAPSCSLLLDDTILASIESKSPSEGHLTDGVARNCTGVDDDEWGVEVALAERVDFGWAARATRKFPKNVSGMSSLDELGLFVRGSGDLDFSGDFRIRLDTRVRSILMQLS